jgi:glucoamylase
MVGCALGISRLWFTLGFGIVNEVYYPRVDIPQIRDLGFIIADGEGFWAEVKPRRQLPDKATGTRYPGRRDRAPARALFAASAHRPRRAARCAGNRMPSRRRSEAEGLCVAGAPPRRHRVRQPRCHPSVSPSSHVWAEQGPFGAALAAVDEKQRDAIGRASAGYVGDSDGWQDFARNSAKTWEYENAGPGNVALMAELPPRIVLALGFGSSAEAAATLVISSLLQPFDNLLQQHIAPWQAWQAERSERCAVPLDIPPALAEEFLVSTVVLRSHLDKTYPGAMVASLSVPWGDTGNERGGYHLVWPRDLVEAAGALLALGAEQEARDTLRYLSATQIEDGHWQQNQWLGGRPFWEGIQLDETAFPVLLAAALDPLPYLEAMTAVASAGGMLPEQVWDADPIPNRRLMRGRPTGSAMPLVWAHAEFIKLLMSRQIGQPIDRPRSVWRGYRGRRPTARHAFWWLHAPIDSMLAGQRLAIALPRSAVVHWGREGWREVADQPTCDSGLGFEVATLDVRRLPPGE